MTARFALVGCGKAKLPHAAPAKELYTGPLFRQARAHVEAEGYRSWRILSAKHYLLDPERITEPYDLALTDLTAAQRTTWGQVVPTVAICCWPEYGAALRNTDEPIEVHVYAGSTYVDAIDDGHWRRNLSYEPPVTVIAPHAGLTLLQRRSAFTAAAKARQGAAA